MKDKIEFEELYKAYELCLKNKKKKIDTYNFTNEELCTNLILLLDELNNRTYKPKHSNCYRFYWWCSSRWNHYRKIES